MKFLFNKLVFAAALTLLATSSANAALTFTVETLSNKSVVITGSGTLDGVQADNNLNLFVFDGLVTNLSDLEGRNVFGSSTMKVGSVAVNFAHMVEASLWPSYSLNGKAIVYAGNPYGSSYFQLGDAVTGQLFLNISDETPAVFAPPGFTGDVEWGINGNLHKVGTFQMAQPSRDVPEPASLALLAGGLLAVGAVRRSRRRA